VVACILRYGLDGTTRARIAEAAGVSPSAVHHFVGTQDEVMTAAVAKALDRVMAITVGAFADLPLSLRLQAQLEVLFADEIAAPEVTQLVDDLIAHSYRDDRTRAAVAALYLRFQQTLDESIDAAFPRAPADDRAVVAHALLALAHSTATFQSLGFDPDQAAKARGAAELLVASLAGRGETTARR
jgi:AcrR family transcriptional regulator